MRAHIRSSAAFRGRLVHLRHVALGFRLFFGRRVDGRGPRDKGPRRSSAWRRRRRGGQSTPGLAIALAIVGPLIRFSLAQADRAGALALAGRFARPRPNMSRKLTSICGSGAAQPGTRGEPRDLERGTRRHHRGIVQLFGRQPPRIGVRKLTWSSVFQAFVR